MFFICEKNVNKIIRIFSMTEQTFVEISIINTQLVL
jgi:hypothetical protein